MKAADSSDALEAFSVVVKLVPLDPMLWLGAGIAAYRLGLNDEAEASLTRALQLQPALSQASYLLGDLQYRSGHIRDAIVTYENALARAPGERKFLERLKEWNKDSAVSNRFYESRGAHFRVLFEGPSDELLARRAVEMLEAAYWRIGGALSTYPPQAIIVVLYTQQQFRQVMSAPEWSGGVYDGRIRVPVRGALEEPAELERVLVHEFVHAVVHRLGGPTVPAWVNEGLATVFEPGGLDNAKRALAQASARPSLKDLHDGFGRLSNDDATFAYAQSAVAVRRMLDLRGAPAVVTLLRDLAAGAAFASAFHQRIAISYDEFQRMVGR